MKPLRIFIGYDPVEAAAYHTLCHSILSRASIPVAITPINLQNLPMYQRKRDPKQSNEFSFSRFLVPYLCEYEGFALFLDCDQMLRCDVAELLEEFDDRYAVKVVKHDYEPHDNIKYLGTVQYKYPRKNWSSVVLWNCGHESNRKINPHYVNTAPALDLHRFTHLKDSEIGELPIGWNWLVGEYSLEGVDLKTIKNVHWTVGGPYFKEYEHADFADEWFIERKLMNRIVQRQELTDKAE